ncbi:transposase [Enterocloster clostridioformis]|uniref:Mutator family transposase n=1 Tax=Enterocloster clostridioformis TaxID=1531 RepID=A0A2X2U9G3_9FIRM|nr:transposase [Enterocloster clostridioformis]SQB10371.1 transposase [Enterocloster clostridioformis]
MDCIHYKVRKDGQVLSRVAYVVLGVTLDGYKDILSITVGVNETSKFWLIMLNDLKNRGMQCVLFFCVDELPYFKEVIRAIFPQSKIQRCVIHMLWNPFKYINYNDWRKFLTDFESVYNALNENAARAEQEDIQDKWGKKDPHAISNWENNWQDVNSFFSFLRKSDGLCTRQISLKG